MFPYVLAPLSFMFQGLPGPVGDPGPKGSRVSGPWQVPLRWGPGWSLPVPRTGLVGGEVCRVSIQHLAGGGTSALPPECSLESKGAAGWAGDGGSLSQVSRLGVHAWRPGRQKFCWVFSHGLAAVVRHLLAVAPSTSQVLGDLSQGCFACRYNPQRPLSCSPPYPF